MRNPRLRAFEKAAGIREPAYFRLWDPSTPTGARRLLCFRDPGRDGYQEKITEWEYLASCPGELPNAEVERLSGQR